MGAGSVSTVARATGLSRVTIHRGLRELDELDLLPAGRSRRTGAGPKRLRAKTPELVPTLQRLVEPTTRGDPMSPLRWTLKSTRVLASELARLGFAVSHATVGSLLREMGYSLQGTRKTREGTNHPDRDAQFRRLNELVVEYQGRQQPVISVDTKKKELVGDFANRGREWQPQGKPIEVRVHDFIDEKLGKAVPYGVYDVTRNDGFVSVGVSHDTSEFAVATIRRWWQDLGRVLYPQATELLITADNGGSNSARTRLWKVELQRLADDTRLKVRVAHLPPGTSKWNKIEHRMFSRITHNWRGTPLTSLEVIVGLIGATKTATGLRIKAVLDQARYEKGRVIPDTQMKALALVHDSFHGDWNYSLHPRPSG
jgi:transposase